MPSVESPSFLTPPTDTVMVEPWIIERGGLPEPLPAQLRDWDPNQDIALKRTIQVLSDQAYGTCHLPAGSELAVVVSWRSPGSGQRGNAFVRVIDRSREPQVLIIDARIPGADIAGTVRIATRLILARDIKPVNPLSPHRAGSILWEDETPLVVEGMGSRFPMEVVDFKDIGYPLRAAWRLYWHRGDLNAQAMGCMCLLLNRRHRRVVAAVTKVVPDPETRAIWSAINAGVAREILCGALADDEFLNHPEQYKEGSAGHVARTLAERAFPGESPKAILERLNANPDLFECSLQAAFSLFDPDREP